MGSFFKKRKESLSFALRGIRIALHQSNFRVMVSSAAIVVALAFFLMISKGEWLILLLVIGLVLSLEMLNTTLETMLDLLEPNFSEKIGVIKDLIAGAVLISCIVAVLTGLMIFVPKIFLW